MIYNTISGDFPIDLSRLGMNYYTKNLDAIRCTLADWGATPPTVEAVLRDYEFACCGAYFPTATPDTMADALQILQIAPEPQETRKIDSGVLYLIYCVYAFHNAYWQIFDKEIRNGDIETKREYFALKKLSTPWRELFPAFLFWLRACGKLSPEDFAGLGAAEIGRALDWIDADGPACSFALYVYIARHILNATPEQLEQLTPPPLYRDIADALDTGEKFVSYLKDLEKKAKQTAETEQSVTGSAVAQTIPKRVADFQARAQWMTIDAKKDGDIVKKYFPVKERIRSYAQQHPEAETFTEYTVHRVIDGLVNLRAIRNVQPVAGKYHLTTSITEFATLCGYNKPNARELAEIRAALDFWRGQYGVIWTPRGQIAMQILNIPAFGVSGELRGTFVIESPEYAFAGQQYLISFDEQKKFSNLQKGAPDIRFKNQLLTKAHKTENDLIEHVFGYDTARADAEDALAYAERSGQPEAQRIAQKELSAVNEYQRKHKANDRRRLIKMFDNAAAEKLITYTRTTNPAGETVYTWKRNNPKPRNG